MRLSVLCVMIVSGIVSQSSFADDGCEKTSTDMNCVPAQKTAWKATYNNQDIIINDGRYLKDAEIYPKIMALLQPETLADGTKVYYDDQKYRSERTVNWGAESIFSNGNFITTDSTGFIIDKCYLYPNGGKWCESQNQFSDTRVRINFSRRWSCPATMPMMIGLNPNYPGGSSIFGLSYLKSDGQTDNVTSKKCVLPSKILPVCKANGDNVGNPCSTTTGNKTLSEVDWILPNSPLKITRNYNSLFSINTLPWNFNHHSQLDVGVVKDSELNLDSQSILEPNSIVRLTRPDGSRTIAQRRFIYKDIAGNGEWFIDRDMDLQLNQVSATTWQIKNGKTGARETYTAQIISVPNTLNNTNSLSNPSEYYQFKLTRLDYPNGQYITYTYQNGLLAAAIDNLGNTLTYQYTNNLLTKILLPNGKFIQYGYDNLNRLVSVQRPGYGIKTYIYDEADKAPNDNPNLLTGIIDENGKRYASYSYDSQNRGISTEHAGGTQKFTLNFSTGITNVNDSYGMARKYYIKQIAGANRTYHTEIGDKITDYLFDANGNIIREIKNYYITTKYTYDISRNLETSKIEAAGTSDSRITLTEWSPNLPVKTKITEGSANTDGSLKQALRITSYTYDNKGNALTKTITDPILNQSRTWTYTHNTNSQKLSETNPQGQTSRWEYDNKGFLTKSTDFQGLSTTYSDLNPDGKPQTITSPTGQITKLTYDAAGRVLTQTVTITNPSLSNLAANQGIINTVTNTISAWFTNAAAPAVKYDISKQPTQTATTSYQYDGVGQLIKTTLPDGQTISYQYDDAHRMIGMTDSLGNTITYTLNPAGDITQTDSKDPQGQLAHSHKQSYDTLGHLIADTGNNGQNQSYGYDLLDNPSDTKDALGRSTQSQYDPLKRKTQETDANGRSAKYTYNALDQLLTVTDSNNVTTTYTYNAFGDVLTTTSSDTGTSTNQYNAKAQLTSQTDGAGRVQNYTYDDKGRIIKRSNNTGKVLTSYSYDMQGRMSLLTDTSGTTAYQYNSNNQVIEKKQTTEGKILLTRYHYTAGGQLDEELLPSGQLVQYQYNKGILTGVLLKTSDGKTTQIIDTISYSPNGIKGYNWSQSKQPVSYQYDLDGRLTQITDPVLGRQYQYDVGNRITKLTDSKANLSYGYEHDKLDRLTKQTFNPTNSLGYGYDSNANRINKTTTTSGVAQTSTMIVKAGTNQYQTYSYDGSGKTLNDGSRSYTYNSEGRIERIQNGSIGVVNMYNALGQRVQKNSGTAKTYFMYDESGKLISESDASGNVVREYVYLGNLPIGLLSNEKPNAVLRIHADHLGTPRAVTDSTNAVLWRWEGDAFGDVQPQVAKVKLPLRMAGQYADDETGLFYNYFRFYDPKTGRYVENDPIDLAGGLNRYGYVGGSPLHMVDPRGQMAWLANPVVVNTVANAIGMLALMAVKHFINKDIDIKADEKTCDEEVDCGNYTRVQAIAKAQAFAMVSRKGREYYTFEKIGEESRGLCFNMLQALGATHVGYVCGWQNNARIEDHPDGHPHQIGMNSGNGKPFPSHHACPHIHAYDGKGNEMEFTYKRGW